MRSKWKLMFFVLNISTSFQNSHNVLTSLGHSNYTQSYVVTIKYGIVTVAFTFSAMQLTAVLDSGTVYWEVKCYKSKLEVSKYGMFPSSINNT